jgi:hypothetical protein
VTHRRLDSGEGSVQAGRQGEVERPARAQGAERELVEERPLTTREGQDVGRGEAIRQGDATVV